MRKHNFRATFSTSRKFNFVPSDEIRMITKDIHPFSDLVSSDKFWFRMFIEKVLVSHVFRKSFSFFQAAIREAGVSRIHGESIEGLLKAPEHHDTMVSMAS